MDHIADYALWCRQCKHKTAEETDEPCAECLSEPVQTDSTKPMKFEKNG